MKWRPQLLNVGQAAELLRVERDVIEDWIEREVVPFVRHADGTVMMPLGGIQQAIVSEGLLDV